jgi:hypothetical protein
VRATLIALSFVSFGIGLDAQKLPPARPVTESAARIARELWPTEVQGSVDEHGLPRFRATVTENVVELPPPWHGTDRSTVRIRWRGGNLHHHEFLAAVTPEQFRSSVLYPAGVSIDPVAVIDGVRSVWRNWQEHRVRTRIQKELEELRAVTAAAPPQ